MSWRLGLLGFVVAAVLSVAAVVVAITGAKGPHGADRVKAAIRWPTNCGAITVRRPSHARIVGRWAPFAVTTADIVCEAVGARVTYIQFKDGDTLDRAVVAAQPSGRYCQTKTAIEIDQLAAGDSTVFADMCRSLSGTLINNAP
jgi:hypothetical protein